MAAEPYILIISWLIVLILFILLYQRNRQLTRLRQRLDAQQKHLSESQSRQARAEAANQAKNRYLSGISHELRTPLNVIMGYAQILERQTPVTDDNHRNFQLIRQNCQHLTHLIEGILEFSAIESGKLRVQSDITEFRPLLDHLIDMFSHQAQQKNLAFVSDLPEQLPQYIKTDSKRLQQILTNLLSNAIKFTPAGQVSLTVSYRNQVATFIIQDTGIGIKPADLQRIFQPFERIESADNQVPGTGLGLTITQLLAELLGGELSVTSNWQKGTTFTLKIMLSAQDMVKQTEQQELHPSVVSQPHSILLVDDIETHRELVRQLLAPLGFQLLEAGSADQARTLIKQQTIDLALLDVSMPGMDGWQLAQWVRDQGHDFPIIMLSANPRDNSPAHPGNHQAYLAKPLQINALLNQLNRLLHLDWSQNRQPDSQMNQDQSPIVLKYKDREKLLELLDIGHINGIKACVNELVNDGKISQQEADRLKSPLNRLNLTQFARLIDHDR
ncbi:hybrid sensor histidine kinase/response regulator [Marinicella sediminis]|uniref:histidine kinase n=1 Tax=Marinicella sediminis TaxID=1792834 RepID=A0ABV7JAK7_9GAMM|nr:ATP-binding protein [Marinicella sediminis]